MNELIKAPPSALVPVETTDDARAALVAARERLARQLDAVQRALAPVIQWQAFVKKHPLVTIGGAFLIGYAISRAFSRK